MPDDSPPATRARTIRQRLALLVLLVLLPTTCISLIAAWTIYTAERRSVTAGAMETAKALSLVADRELAYRAGILKALSTSPALDRADLSAFHEQARAVTPTDDAYIVLTDAAGRSLLDTQSPLGSTTLHAAPLLVPAVRPASGAAVAMISDLYLAPGSQRHSFAVGVPVLRDGRLRWQVTMSSQAASLQRIFDQQPLPSGWTGTLVDRTGAVVARNLKPMETVGRRATPDMMARMAAETSGLHETQTLDGTPVVTVFTHAPDSGWMVLIGLPQAELRKTALRALGAMLLASVALSALALLAALRVAGTIARPVARLQADAEALGQGQPVPAVATGLVETDVVQSSLARASAALREADETLQARVRQAVAEAERAHQIALGVQKLEALGRLTGGIAHDFNNLLQTMTTGLQLASVVSTDPRAQRALAACQRAVAKAVTLTRQLMTFGTAQPGLLLIVDLRRWLPGLSEMLHGALRETVAVTIEVDPATSPVQIDPVQFELAILNLALNARDAMNGHGALRISAANRRLGRDDVAGLPAGEFVAITVADNGSGIPPEVLGRVFEPFFTTKPVGKGSGLGLAQVYALARQLGGAAQLESEVGVGTVVSLLLPRASGLPAEAPVSEQADSLHFSGTVLLVEDNALVRGLTAEALERFGFAVLVASAADDALAIARSRTDIDAVLSDIVMPGEKSGIDLMRALRELYPGLPVVLASGYATALAEPLPVPVVAKPYDVAEIARLLAQQIGSAAR